MINNIITQSHSIRLINMILVALVVRNESATRWTIAYYNSGPGNLD
jgi:hypothetical protein